MKDDRVGKCRNLKWVQRYRGVFQALTDVGSTKLVPTIALTGGKGGPVAVGGLRCWIASGRCGVVGVAGSGAEQFDVTGFGGGPFDVVAGFGAVSLKEQISYYAITNSMG